MVEHWLISLRFKDDKEKEEFLNIFRKNKTLWKKWNIEHLSYIDHFETRLPVIKVTKK